MSPLIDVAGAFFPAWILCIFVAIAATGLLRLGFARAGIERALGPLILLYPSLATALPLTLWLLFFPPGIGGHSRRPVRRPPPPPPRPCDPPPPPPLALPPPPPH